MTQEIAPRPEQPLFGAEVSYPPEDMLPDEWREFGEDREQHERAEYVLDRWEEESYD